MINLKDIEKEISLALEDKCNARVNHIRINRKPGHLVRHGIYITYVKFVDKLTNDLIILRSSKMIYDDVNELTYMLSEYVSQEIDLEISSCINAKMYRRIPAKDRKDVEFANEDLILLI